MKSSFLKAGHWPTLLAAFLYFDLAFMVWVLLGPLGVQIAKDLGLDAAQKGLMVAVPVHRADCASHRHHRAELGMEVWHCHLP
jgi:nitrate/nitrite transporter NarK